MSSILPRSVTSPKKFFIGSQLLASVGNYMKDFGDNAFIISDEFFLEKVNKEALASIK